MAFVRFEVIVIFGDGTQQRFTFPASSPSEAESKARAAVRGSASSRGGISDVMVERM